MLYLYIFVTLAAAVGSQAQHSRQSCVECLHPIWYKAVSTNINTTSMELCSTVSMQSVFRCLEGCDVTAAGQPMALKIRQLTQISDIFYALLANNCSLPAYANGTELACKEMAQCVVSTANYEYENATGHAPYSTVFSYDCGVGGNSSSELMRNQTSQCVMQAGVDCVDMERIYILDALISMGVEAACDEPRRCVKYGAIFEVKPGSNCTEYYQEPSAYGPSTGAVSASMPGEGFNTETCSSDRLSNINCPEDPEVAPVFTEKPPTTTTEKPTTTGVMDVSMLYPDITIDTNLTCEQCLYPLWYRAVTTNGSHLCQPKFQEQVYSCLAKCKCCAQCTKCSGRHVQHNTEVFVKLADINKALAMNNCSGNTKCTAASYGCTENLAVFQPPSAPHVTVNTLSCSEKNLASALQCYSSSCDASTATTLSAATIAGFDPVCNSKLRCMTYGNIYEYIPVEEIPKVGGKAAVPCTHFRRMGVNGWRLSTHSETSRPGLLFNTQKCLQDWPASVDCPAVISIPGMM